MARHNDLGKQGEQIAQHYLAEHGYEIVECDWHIGHNDADIIARKDGLLVFVEVKTRTGDAYGEPEDWVDRKKQRAYIRLANSYVQQHNIDDEVRFDIISIILNQKEYKVTHLIGAFSTIG